MAISSATLLIIAGLFLIVFTWPFGSCLDCGDVDPWINPLAFSFGGAILSVGGLVTAIYVGDQPSAQTRSREPGI